MYKKELVVLAMCDKSFLLRINFFTIFFSTFNRLRNRCLISSLKLAESTINFHDLNCIDCLPAKIKKSEVTISFVFFLVPSGEGAVFSW